MRLDAARRAFGLPPNKKSEIDEDELKRIYRKEAIKCHPDKCPGDENATARFQELSEAYQILTGQADPSDDEWSSDDEWTYGTKNAGRQRNTKKKQQQTKSAPKQRRQRKSRGQRGSKAAKDFFEDLFGVRKPYTPPLPNACVHAHLAYFGCLDGLATAGVPTLSLSIFLNAVVHRPTERRRDRDNARWKEHSHAKNIQRPTRRLCCCR
jgi:hypothetical protein